MLNAMCGVRRVLRRVPRASTRRASAASATRPRFTERASDAIRAAASAAHLFPARVARPPADHELAVAAGTRAEGPGVATRLGERRASAIVVAVLLIGATAVSTLAGAAGPVMTDGATAHLQFASIGGPSGNAAAPRIAAGGDFGVDRTGIVAGRPRTAAPANAIRQLTPITLPDTSATDGATVSGPFLDDGTLLKPVSVETTVDDARDMLRTYTVKRGDTIDAVGRKFKVSPSTIYWANDLKNTRLVKGWKLTIPPVTGLVVTVKATDTLASLAKAHKIKPDAILAANKLEDPNLVMGQVLVMPGARGPKMVQAPKPKKVAPKGTTSKSGAVAGGGPARYTGGRFVWPVAGGGDVSRGFAGGHQGLDVAADTGTGVKAAAGGKVIFAGWKSNGGGYQVWISHGSGLYTTYNHMSSISVGTGQSVGRGQRIGGVGSTGNSSGPHLHFEVWKGSIWNGGSRVNPMGYL